MAGTPLSTLHGCSGTVIVTVFTEEEIKAQSG